MDINTSITVTKAEALLNSATLACSNITGFHKTGASWRLRYNGLNDKGVHARKVVTIGKFPQAHPKDAVLIISNWGNDHLADKKNKKLSKQTDYQQSKARNLKLYLQGSYSEHQSGKKPAVKKQHKFHIFILITIIR